MSNICNAKGYPFNIFLKQQQENVVAAGRARWVVLIVSHFFKDIRHGGPIHLCTRTLHLLPDSFNLFQPFRNCIIEA